LAAYAPLPYVISDDGGYHLVEDQTQAEAPAFGRMVAFHGQMGMFVRALSYMMSHGSDGLRQVAEDAVLNANYVLATLKDVMSAPFGAPCMHEALFDDSFLKDTGVDTLDFAKAMIDEGYHPMTMYFPLVVHGAMLIEPTETESKATLDLFVATMRDLVASAKAGDLNRFKQAPELAPRRRLDETQAARNPVLRWQADISEAQAAE
jgi:glycine dehydrogenase subunit 2